MKIRNGFVSNSSSSSFIAVASQLNADEIKPEDIANGLIWAVGKSLSEGEDVFQINDQFALHILNTSSCDDDWKDDFDVYKIYKHEYDEYDIKINIKLLKELGIDEEQDVTVIQLDKDYASCQETLDIYERYVLKDFPGNEKNRDLFYGVERQFYRENKLKRVLKDEKDRT